MVKQRMATADIAAEIACLKQRGIVGMRCTNVYDISSRMYVLKLARSGEDGEKVLLLIESGARLHTVDTMPEKSHVPSNFSLKLRKHIRSRRLEDICQLGVDRIVQLTFGSADTTVHLLLEFYAQGNVILADGKYEVLTLLRSHRDDAKGMATMARHTYPIHTVRMRESVPSEALRAAVKSSFVGAVGGGGEGGGGAVGGLEGEGNATLDSEVPFSSSESKGSEQEEREGGEEGEGGDNEKAGGASATVTSTPAASASRAADASLKTALDVVVPYGRLVAEHCILTAGLDPARQPSVSPLSEAEHAALLSAVRSFEKWLDGCEGAAPGGAILLSQKKVGKEAGKEGKESSKTEEGDKSDTAASDNADTAAVYEEFHPLLAGGLPFAQHMGLPMLTFPTFDAAVAEFFGKIQGQRTASQQATREKAAMGKLEAIRRDHESRLSTLGKDVVEAEHKAALIELNLDAVDAALNAVREALAGGIDWADLSRMIKDEKKAGNPVAALIDSLQLEKSKITLLLRDSLYDDDDEGEEEEEEEEYSEKEGKGQQSKSARHRPTVSKVEVDLELTAHANARTYYDARRKHTDKTRRTLEANERALAAAEKKAREQLERVRGAAAGAGAAAAAVRKPYWFERFHWFISSENHLVLSGRDAQQNELLVKRYLRRGDVYVHADLHGASSTIIKNPDPATPIPPLTLSEAGQACVCRSAAWDAKVVTSAWWVHPDQVSKTAPTGEYLTTGSFMIRGRKNYLPPQPLVMGLAWLFRLEEGSVSAHLGERVPRWMGTGSGSGVAGLGAGIIVGEGDEQEIEAEASSDAQIPVDGGADGGGGSNEVGGAGGGQSALDAFMDSSVDAMASSVTATYNRYGLAEGVSAAAGGRGAEEEQQLEGAAQAQAQGDRPATRHLSAKEQQLMKKGILPSAGPLPPPQPKQKKKEGAPDAAGGGGGRPLAAAPSAATDQQGGSKAARGKKTRRKAKYDDQDEEDRELAMALLQSAGQRKDRKQRKDDRKAKLAAKKAAKSSVPSQNVTAEDIAKLTARLDLPSDDEKSGADEGEEGEREERDNGSELSDSGSAASSDGEGGDAGGGDTTNIEVVVGDSKNPGINKEKEDSEAEAARKERAEVAEMLAEENVGLLDEADKERLTQLDELTGCPRVEDVLLYAVPMCAPYQVVAGYKYRVKLVPGTQKKGKAYRQAVELLAGLRTTGGGGGGSSGGGGAAAEAGALRERELVRAVPEPDGINAMVGGVKLQVAGLQKMQQAKKKAGKKK